jgi:hypothetical protein
LLFYSSLSLYLSSFLNSKQKTPAHSALSLSLVPPLFYTIIQGLFLVGGYDDKKLIAGTLRAPRAPATHKLKFLFCRNP